MSDNLELTVTDGQIVVTEEVANLLKTARMLDTTIKELSEKRDSIVKALKDAMDKNGINKFESGILNINRTAYSTKTEINVEKLKRDGLYEQYCYSVPSGGSLRVSYPKEKKNG